MKRRTLLSLVALVPLAACANQPTSITSAAGDAQTLAAALEAVSPELLSFVADPTTKTTIQADIALAIDAAAKVQAATVDTAEPLVSQIIAAVQTLGSLVLPLAGIPPATFAVINAALNLLPALAAAVGILAVSNAPLKQSLSQSRAVLKAAAL